jgi:hypothetical protein
VSLGFVSASAKKPTLNPPSEQKGGFQQQGEYWTIAIGERAVGLKHSKGLAYIADLLRHPARNFHVLDLAGGSGGREEQANLSARGLTSDDDTLERSGIHVDGLGDAGELLDDQAKRAYRHRLAELREELEQAKEVGKVEGAEPNSQEDDQSSD